MPHTIQATGLKNGDIARCNVSNTEGSFLFFFNNKNVLLFKKTKKRVKKQIKPVD